MDKQKLEQYLKYGAAALAIGLGGFAALFLIKSVIALAIVVFGGLAIVNGAPVFAQWAAQMRVKGTLALSAKNPVEDLILLRQKKQEALTEAGAAITAFATETKDYGDKLEGFKARRPEKAKDFQVTYDKMSKVLAIRRNKLKQAQNELKKFDAVIEEAQDIWSMTQAAIKANQALNKFDKGDPMDEIRQKTALDSVTSSLNQVMAELETSLAMDYNSLDDATLAVENNPSDVIDVDPVTSKETVNVPRRS